MTTTAEDFAWFAPSLGTEAGDAAPLRVADEVLTEVAAEPAEEMSPEEAEAERVLRDSEAERRAFLATRYPDAHLDASYQTADLVYLRWRERLEYARRTHALAREEPVDGLADSEDTRAANGAGMRQFLAASPRLAAFAHLPDRDDDDAASNAAQQRLDALLDDDARSLELLAVGARLDARVAQALTDAQWGRMLQDRRALGTRYRAERAETAAKALAERGSLPPPNAYDRRIDAYTKRTERLAGVMLPAEPDAEAAFARALIGDTPWSGARAARDRALPGRTVALADARAGKQPDRDAHGVLGRHTAFARYAATAGRYARDQLEAVRWRESHLLLAHLPDAAAPADEGTAAAWTVHPEVAVHEGARVALAAPVSGADATDLWLAQRGPQPGAPLRLTRYAVARTGGKVRHKQTLALPWLGDVPVSGLDVSAAHVVLLQVDGTLTVLRRDAATGRVDERHGAVFCLPLATCMALARTAEGTADALWVGDEMGFAYELELSAVPLVPVWTRTLWTGDLERVVQVQARGTRVTALTKAGAYVWDVPRERAPVEGEPAATRRLFKPVFLQMPEVLSVALHGAHLAVLDRLGTVTFVHVRAQAVDGQSSVLHEHLRGGARLHYSSGSAGGSGAAHRHVQWDADGTGAWVVYPSGSALLRLAFDVPPPPPPPPLPAAAKE